jgi:hypothetical protein
MLSVKRCREILGADATVTDERLEHLRDEMYALAGVVVERIAQSDPRPREVEQDRSGVRPLKAALRLLPGDDTEDVEERAAIIEFEAGVDRDEAERRAIMGTIERQGRNGQSDPE